MKLSSVSCLSSLLAAGMAGCLEDGDDGGQGNVADPLSGIDLESLSPKVFDILPPEEIWVTASDGMRMNTVAYRPDTNAAAPVFINFSPYWGDSATTQGDHFSQYMINEYVPRGYTVVLASLRGTGHSEGCFEIGSDREVQDLNEVVDFYSKQAWSNGKIASGGKSYDSSPLNGMIAKFPHPALRGVFHVSGITDMYAYNVRNGVVYGPTQGTIFNALYAQQGLQEYGIGRLSNDTAGVDLIGGRPGDAGTYEDEDAESLARILGDVACVEQPDIQASGAATAASGVRTPYWVERDWKRYVSDSGWDGSIFFVHGLAEQNVRPDHILPWLISLPPGIQVKGWLHQETFTPYASGTGHVYPMRTDWNVTMLAWLDHILLGKANGFEALYTVEAAGSDGLWRASATWPPHDAAVTATGLLPGADGSLDVVLSPGRPLRLAGAPSLDVTITTSNSDPVFTALLYDVNLTSGARSWINEAVLRGVLADSLERPVPVPAGEPRRYSLEFYPMDHVVEVGHGLAIVLGGDPQAAMALPSQLADVEYDAGGGVLSFLSASPEPMAVQPTPMRCFAC